MASMDSFSLLSVDKKWTGMPPPSIQGRLLPDPFISIHEDDWEHAVSQSWLAQWIHFASPRNCSLTNRFNNTTASGSSSMTSSRGSSLTDDAFDLSKALGPVLVCEIDVENVYIAECVWNTLHSWYGIDGTSLRRRRHRNITYVPVTPDGANSVLCDNRLDILMVDLCMADELDHPQKHTILQLYAWDTMDFWENQLKEKMALPESVPARFWLVAEKCGLEKSLQLYSGRHLSFMQFLTMLFPDLVEFMQQRQTKAPAPEHRTAFSSFHSSPNQSSWTDPDILQNTKSYLFQELLLNKYQITVVVERIMSDQLSVELVPSLSTATLCLSMQSDKGENSVTEWEDNLSEILDNVCGEMHGKIDTTREKVETACKTVVSNMLKKTNTVKESLQAKIIENNTRAKGLDDRERDVIKQETNLNEKLQKFKIGLSDFLVQKKRLEDDLKRIENLNKIAASKVKLNVGGSKFETSLETVAREPESVLGLMFSGKHSITLDEDGSYFIDRDGTNFRYILKYLRDGQKSFPTMPMDTRTLREIQEEAIYYGLKELAGFIGNKIGH